MTATPRALRWGIVGLGSLAEHGLVPAARRASHATIVACSTRDPATARDFAARHGIPRWHPDHESLARDPEVDAVFVATPNAHHVAPVLAAAAAGKPVLCEKPLALAVSDAERMIAACLDAEVMLRLGLHLRFERFFDRVAAAIRGGEIGTLRALSIERAAPPAERVPWREDPAQGGSVLYDVGVHLLDLAPRLIGAPLVSVAGLAHPPPGQGGADTITLLAAAATGAQVTIRVTREAPRAAADLTALGTGGFLKTGPLRWVPEYRLMVTDAEGATREERAMPCDLYRDELDGFAMDLADGGTRLGTGADGLRLVHVAAAVEQALREGRSVALPPP